MKKLILFFTLTFTCAAVVHAADTFRVMTYNIQHGEGLDKKIDLLRIAEVIKREKADIVALEEVDKGVKRTDKRDLTAELAALTGMTGVFYNNHPYQGGEYGNAILSRFPVLTQTNLHYHMLRTNEQRGAMQLTLDVQGKKIFFIGTHLDFRPDDKERLLNVSQLKELVTAQSPMPTIICGDFNCVPTSATHKAMAEFLTDAWTVVNTDPGFSWRSDKPDRRIDYQWITTNSLVPLKAWVPDTLASDHRPVVIKYKLK